MIALPNFNGRADGERRKLGAHAVLEAHREAIILRGRRALLDALLTRDTASADDVRAGVELPAGIDPVCLGAVPGPLARARIIRADGFAKTCRAIGHARPVTRWALLDRTAAIAWLRDHPDKPDPDNAEACDTPGSLFTETNPNKKTGASTPAH